MAVVGQGVAVVGFTQLQKALGRIEGKNDFGVEYELQRRLKLIGENVAAAAPTFITHRTGRGSGELEGSVRVAVTQRSASVYSTSDYGGVQNVGGGPHAGWAARGPHVQAGNASHWMNRAVASRAGFVKDEMDGLLDWVVTELEID